MLKTGSSGSDMIQGQIERILPRVLQLSRAGSISAIDSLLAVQSIENSVGGSQQAVDHGKELLEFLDDIRLGILTGSVSQEKIKKLKQGIDNKRGWVVDKKLTQILEEIELRAAVELAKIEMSQGG